MTTPLVPWERDLPGELDAHGWLRLLADEPGLVMFERPDNQGCPCHYLSFDPQPADLLGWEPPGLDGEPPAPFFGGWAGVLSYDLGRRFEDLPDGAVDEGWPDIAGGLYGFAVAVEPGRPARLVGAHDREEGGGSLERRFTRLSERLATGTIPPRDDAPALRDGLRSNMDRSTFVSAVARAVEYIHAGDIFQVNLARRIEGTLSIPPLEAALRLQEGNPAPRSAVVSLGQGRWVLSSSPELLLEVKGRHAVTRPIKGTRPRVGDETADGVAREELMASVKDGAELAMIVDLERNDLGRVARWGGVRVADPRRLETYETVFHTEAVVEADLRDEVGPGDLVRALFPGGSITGAPKIRAMEIIEELEPVRRGAYTGSAGWFGWDGGAHWNILIRTLSVDGDRVHFGVGGGMVADSDPQSEFEETVTKGLALARALGADPL